MNNKLSEKVAFAICSACGRDFAKPGSCEECMTDSEMIILREYETKVAEGKIKNDESYYRDYQRKHNDSWPV